MRIHITGFIIWVVWCIFAAWIYNDYLLPALRKPVPEVIIPVVQTNEADSLMKLKASMPKDLLIWYEFNKTEFKPDQLTEKSIADFKAWLDKYPQSMLTVTGHSDLVGTLEYNQELGMKRAELVGKYLEKQGVSSSRMSTGSKGETQPLGSYLTEEGRAKNRRTEVSIKMQ